MLTGNLNLGIIVYVVSSLNDTRTENNTFKQKDNIVWLFGQAVKTPPFHGGNRGSIPLRVTIFILWAHSSAGRAPALQAGGHRFEPCCAHHEMA